MLLSLVALLVLALAWPVGLLLWANGKISHVTALSGASDTPGRSILIAGSDSREDGAIPEDGTEGSRTDTIMLLHSPESGPTALISLPRDTFVDVPGHGPAKLNSAYAWGGAPLLVETVESLTGITIDHYVEIGLGGVEQVVDAVGGVELCLDYEVDDERSGLVWEQPGCEEVDGTKALAFVRMRYSDPNNDLGRAERQRQLVGSVVKGAASPATIVNPLRQAKLVDAGVGAVTVDEDSGILDLAQMALAFRRASGPDGITGTPDIANPDYRPGGVGSSVLLDPDTTPAFFTGVMNGTLEPGQYPLD